MADDTLSEEDKALFQEHMRSVKPLHEKNKKAITPKTPPKVHPPKKTQATKEMRTEIYLSDYIRNEVLSETILSYSGNGLPSKRFKELKNGLIPWESRLDLHGLKTDAARVSLQQFISLQYHQHKRCLLIVHGKGGHQGSPPVIKNLVNRWLPQFNEVLAFHSALPKDGGQGAVYVLLKRHHDLR